MVKILTTNQVKDLDRYTIENEPISSIDLMERACMAFTNWFVSRYTSKNIGIVCGTGNNGGDGLGIARILKEKGFAIHVWVVRGDSKETADFKTNLHRLSGKLTVSEIISQAEFPDFEGCDVLIDAIFGSGLSRPVEGIYASVIDRMNCANAIKVAVDIPSGLLADQPSKGSIVKAHQTVSFQTPKLAFLFPENSQFVGDWVVVDIGLAKAYIDQLEGSNFLLDEDDVKKILRPRLRFSHKGTYGHALLVAGSHGKMGAGVLSARAALRSGVGLLTVHVPISGYEILQSSVPEAMTSIDENENFFSSIPQALNYQSIGIGPGLGKNPKSAAALGRLLKDYAKPMVIDADALNLISENRELISLIPAGSILTPHPKEFERLVGSWANDFERLEKQRNFSNEKKAIVVLKGAFTSISTPSATVSFNPTGNAGMATGGSGDVLTGVLTGLLAQGYPSEQAAVLGVYLHGLSGDLAVQQASMNSLIASDLIDFLPGAFRKIQKEKPIV
jgi:NAD(P)H-hydrate epimerase